jgi:hypothetical protein
MAKALKFFSGHGYLGSDYKRKGSEHQQVNIYIAAYTKKEGLELLNTVCSGGYSMNHFNNYFSGLWGTRMEETKAGVSKPCVYSDETWGHLHLRLIYTK